CRRHWPDGIGHIAGRGGVQPNFEGGQCLGRRIIGLPPDAHRAVVFHPVQGSDQRDWRPPGMTDELELKRYNTTTANEIYDEMVQLFVDANRDILHLPFFSREQFEAAFVNQRAQDGFELVTARMNGKLVGVIFGFTEIPREQYAVCELMVHPEYQR